MAEAYQTRSERRIERTRKLKIERARRAVVQQQIDFLQSRIGWETDAWIARQIARIEQEFQNASAAAAAAQCAHQSAVEGYDYGRE